MDQKPTRIADPSNSEAQWRRSEERFWQRSGTAQAGNRRGFFWIVLALVFVFLRVFFGNATFQ